MWASSRLAIHPPLAALPRLETERLSLAPLSMADADAVASLTNDPAITEVINFLPTPFTRSDAEALIGRNDEANCFVGAFLGGDLVGVVGAHAHGDDRLEIGYWIGTKFQRQGYALEATSGVMCLLRDLYPARQLIAECRSENDASWALLHKLGFRATGQAGNWPGHMLLALP